MNIFGEGFPNEILNQINYRQKVYGSGYSSLRTSDQIAYLTSKTSWCKLSSGVNIENLELVNNPTIKSLGIKDSELAKKFVLFNGTSDQNNNQRAGINYNNTPPNNILGGNAAYGIGGTEFGSRPMMGIQTVSVKHENRGSLRRAEVKIKAFNRAQFEIIDILYLRLGFSVLLEWGHSIIIDNNGNIDTKPTYLDLTNEFLNGNYTYNEFLQLIYNKRLSTGGNYDAMLAKVANFQWSFNPDGSYDITLKLSSIGDVIESLKVNILTDSTNTNNSSSPTENKASADTTQEIFETDIAGDIIDAFSYNSTLGNFLHFCKILVNKIRLNYSKSTNNIFPDDVASQTMRLNTTSDAGRKQIQNIIEDPNNNVIQFDISRFEPDMEDIMFITFDDLGGGGGGPGYTSTEAFDDIRYYIRLGTFLRFLQEFIVPTVYNKNKKSNPSLNFDTDENTNLMNANPLQVSVDPRICWVNRTLTLNSSQYVYGPSSPVNPFINSIVTNGINKEDIQYGNIMNIYLEMTFILKTVNQLKDDKGNISLIDFLKGLMSGINEGLGGINDFDVFLDETDNTVKIIDKNVLNFNDDVITIINNNFSGSFKFNNNRSYNPILTNSTILELYGYNKTQNETKAGFISEFNFTTELSPQFSTMITVGAAAQGTVVGENDTALSKLNLGLSDRYKTAIANDINASSKTDPYSKEDYTKRKTEYENMRNDYINFLIKLSNGTQDQPNIVLAEDKDINNFKTILPSLLQKAIEVDTASNLNSIQEEAIKKHYQGTGFIPFNLALTLDGISGIKINQQFLLDTSYLPTNYPNTMKFLIKNLSHEIQDNKWKTKIETYCIPKAADTEKKRSIFVDKSNTTPSPTPSPNPNYISDSNYPNVKFQNIGLGNPAGDKINPNLLQDISKAAKDTGVIVSITTAVSGHKSTPPTRHTSGNAVDIAIIDGIRVKPNASNRSKIDAFVKALIGLGYTKNTESGNPKAVLTFGFPNHDDHIHISNRNGAKIIAATGANKGF